MIQIKNKNNSTTNINSNVECNNIICNLLDTSNVNVAGEVYVNYQPYSPVGVICIYSGEVPPAGWLLCDGSAISRIQYSRLYSVINTLYGNGDGITTFNLPNLQEMIPVGKSFSKNLGETGGNNTITLTPEQLPSHSHTGTTSDNGSHSHNINDTGHTHNLDRTSNPDSGAYDANNSNSTSSTACTTDRGTIGSFSTYTSYTGISIIDNGNHSHTFTTNETGNGAVINIQNKFIILNYIIRY